jgi:sporulation protein YlmC with PRC-barrel domain
MKKFATLFIALVVMLVFSGTLFAAGAEKKTEEGAMGTPQSYPVGKSVEPYQPPVVEKTLPVEGQPMAVPRADAIIGLAVINEQGQQLGEVKDLTLSADGRINYLIISKGGIWGFGSKLYAIPWKEANARIHENAVIVGLSKDRFESAPTFDNWNELANGGYEQQVRAYYGEESSSKGVHSSMMEPGQKAGMSGSPSETGSESK